MNILYIAMGAMLGALLRYGLQLLFSKYYYPTGTLLANFIGCFLIGIAYSYSAHMSQEVRIGLITGFLGSLTTLSSLSLDVVKMIEQKQWYLAFGFAAFTVVGGLLLTGLGIYLGAKGRAG